MENKKFFNHDTDIVKLENRNDLQKYLDHIKEDDVVQNVYINECAALGMINAPLLLPSFMADNKIDCDDQDAAECCEDYGIFLVFPTELKMETLPTRYTAFKSICARAGLSCVSMSNTEEKPNVKPLAPDRKAAIITECLKLYSDTAQILIRDGKVSAMHSKIYGWLMPYDIIEPFEHFAKLTWPNMEFSYGEVSHEYLYADYYLHDELAEDSMKLLLEQFGAKIDGKLKAGIRVSTSDVADAALRFSPFYEINGTRVRIGRPLEVIHHAKNTLEKVREKVFPEIGMLLKIMDEMVRRVVDELQRYANSVIKSNYSVSANEVSQKRWKGKSMKNLKEQAVKRYKENKRNFSGLIQTSVRETQIYSRKDKYYASTINNKSTKDCILINTDTVSAACSIDGKNKVCVLNFASFTTPGGGFIEGAMAQEEAICHKSTLYNVLLEKMDFYNENCLNENHGLYTDRAIYSPSVLFLNDVEGNKLVDVLTCAAPNKHRALTENVSDKDIDAVMERRIEFMYDVALANQVDTLILGAWGCGVFGNNPETICRMLIEHRPEEIEAVFAIPGGINYDAFQKVFDEMEDKL